jgi:hypothetical protein
MIGLNLLHVSVTFCGHLQEGVFRRMYYKDNEANVQLKNIKFYICESQ